MNFFYFEIAIPMPIRGSFIYKCNSFLRNGSRVEVSFRNRTVMGIVIQQVKKKPEFTVKEVKKICEKEPIFNKKELDCLIWASRYYHHPIGDVFNTFTPKLLKTRKKGLELEKQYEEESYELNNPENSYRLTNEQINAIENIKVDDNFKINLINGVTGSGKTEIYIDLTAKKIKENKSVLILVPEINLTPQLHKVFSNRFKGEIGLYHSKQTPLQRLNVWKKAREGLIKVVIGTRSAIMNPMKDIGLIIIDEEHDQSFKQSEGFKFSAREMGIKRAQVEKIPIVLGSATPSFSILKLVEEEKVNEVKMVQRVDGQKPPKLIIMDINNKELIAGISRESLDSIRAAVNKSSQVLVFINRRGFAPLLECSSCGWTAECNSCESNLVYHKTRNRLVCHRCEAAYGKPSQCPNCSLKKLELFGLGTERVEEFLSQSFPDVDVIRIDHDTTKKKGAMDKIYERLKKKEAAILVGTQMLTKGHDFDNVSLTLVLNADNGLVSPEINALEKVSQLLIQVSGRAGRKNKNAKVIIQTRHPNDETLNQIRGGSYSQFSCRKLKENKVDNFPPYSCATILRATSPTQESNILFLKKVDRLIRNQKNIEVIGPLPSFISKTKGSYKHSLYIQTSKRTYLNRVLNHLTSEIDLMKESKKVKWSFDIDPLDYF